MSRNDKLFVLGIACLYFASKIPMWQLGITTLVTGVLLIAWSLTE